MAAIMLICWLLLNFPINIYGASTTPAPGSLSVTKNLMLLKAGSGTRFDTMWGLDSYNDDGNTKSDMDLVDILSQGEFKAAIDPSWGESEWVLIGLYTTHGDIIGEMQFYAPNKNITGQTAWMSSTFDILLPLNIDSTKTFTASEEDKELLVRQTGSSDTWMAVYHGTSGLDPEFVLATYVSQTFETGTSTSASNSYMGCKPTTTIAALYKLRDLSSMSVESCITLCELTEYLYVGIKFGHDCYCVNISIANLYDDLPAYCTKTCTGDSAQTCGGISDAYMSVYNATPLLPSLSGVINTTLLTVTHTTGYITEHTINLQNEGHWQEDYIYINGLEVIGKNSSGYNVSYYIEYLFQYGDTFAHYGELNGTVWTAQTGVTYDIEVLLLRQLTVKFSESTTGVTINLIGPTGNSTNPGYVKADYMLVSGTFTTATTTISSPSESSTHSPTTTLQQTSLSQTATISSNTTLSQSTSATAAPMQTSSTLLSPSSSTTVASTTTAVSKYSIVINGQVYCPCTVSTNNVTNVTVDIAAIIAELTLDKDTLSSNTRRYNSAYDSRPSAKTLGALGVIVISLVVGLIVAMDSANLKAEAVKIKKNYRHLKKQLSNRSLRIDDISTTNIHDPNAENLPDVLM